MPTGWHLNKPGPPGADGKDGDPVVISQDTPPPVVEDYYLV